MSSTCPRGGAVPLGWVIRVGLGRFRHSGLRNELLQFNRGLIRPLLHLRNEKGFSFNFSSKLNVVLDLQHVFRGSHQPSENQHIAEKTTKRVKNSVLRI